MDNYEMLRRQNSAQAVQEENALRLAQEGMQEMTADSAGAAALYHNPEAALDDIDRRFAEATSLGRDDVVFLLFATALQCARQYFLTNFKERTDAADAARNTRDHEAGHSDRRRGEWYLPGCLEIISNPVPYDTNRQIKAVQGALKGGGKLGHRMTLGHDPILGWIFGTANIATSTITTWKPTGMSVLPSYHVKSHAVNDGVRQDVISQPVSTKEVLEKAQERFFHSGSEGYGVFATSLWREWDHLKSDVNSKNSLPFPCVSLISPELANQFAEYGLDQCNVNTILKQAAYAQIINAIIGTLHGMYCYYLKYDDAAKEKNIFKTDYFSLQPAAADELELYRVRTHKILLYSNLIASASNVIFVAVAGTACVKSGNEAGAKKVLSYLDVGGLMVTLYRLVADTNFIRQVKAEFLEQGWYRAVVGDEYHFMEEAAQMSQKDVEKGIAIQAKADAARADKVAQGLAAHAEVLKKIESAQRGVRATVDTVLQGMSEAEAQGRYGLGAARTPADLGVNERRALCAAVYTLLAEHGQNTEQQTLFYLKLEQCLGVAERAGGFDFAALSNIDSHADRLAVLRALCAFLFLHDESCTFAAPGGQFDWLYAFASQKDVSDVCAEIQKEFDSLGTMGLLNGCTARGQEAEAAPADAAPPAEAPAAEAEPAESESGFSGLAELIEKYVAGESTLGKKAAAPADVLSRELARSFPRVAPGTALAATRIGNGYLIFTTAALYLRTGSLLRGEYVRLCYRGIRAHEITTAAGRLSGTRKIVIPYLDENGGTQTVSVDDLEVQEERLRDLLIEIADSGCRTADTDLALPFAELEAETRCRFGGLLCYALQRDHRNPAAAYLFAAEQDLTPRWNEMCGSVNDEADFAAQTAEFFASIPYPSGEMASRGAVEHMLRANAAANLMEDRDMTLLAQPMEQSVRKLETSGMGESDFNRLLKQLAKQAAAWPEEKLKEAKDRVHAENPDRAAEILAGLEALEKRRQAAEPEKGADALKKAGEALEKARETAVSRLKDTSSKLQLPGKTKKEADSPSPKTITR